MKKVYEKFCKFEQALAIFLLSLITVLVFAAALTRTFGFPINWAQDVALIAFAWLVFIGGDISVRTTGLIGVDLFVKMFPKKVQKGLDILFKVIILVFLAVLAIYGYQYVLSGYKRMITTLNVTYATVTASVPVGALLMMISTSVKLVESIKKPVDKWGE